MTEPKNEEQIIEEHQQRLATLELAQEDLYHERKRLEETQDILNTEQLRSKAWLEKFEMMVGTGGKSRARVGDLWSNYHHAVHEVDSNLEEAFHQNSKETECLIDEKEQAINDFKKSCSKAERMD